MNLPASRGRGVSRNPPNRFETLRLEPDPDDPSVPPPAPDTRFLIDHSSTIITRNDSPDVGFTTSVNPYRGCEHGCAYCYARPTHEYLGFSSGLDFETRIMVKRDAPALLRRELASSKWTPQVIAMSGVTDCYQPIERKLLLTRGCLEVLAAFLNPVAIVTKNHLVTRDIPILRQLAEVQAAMAFISVTTLDSTLASRLEPRASLPAHRLDAVAKLREAGIPAGILIAPVIPGLNDHEIPAILSAAANAGALYAGYVLLRLPHGLPLLFEQWLDTHYPARKNKVLQQLKTMRGGKLNETAFGARMRGQGLPADNLNRLFHVARRKAGIPDSPPSLSTSSFHR